MTLLRHELRQGKNTLGLWTLCISFLLGICILIYPEMAGQMTEISTMFADMGNFSAAFGMDQINFGEFKGYFGVECGNTLGIGGALFAALLGISALAKEEKDHTAEFLLSHPISRSRVFGEKLLSVFLQVLFLNVVIFAVTMGATLLIGESLPWKEATLLLLSFLLLQLEICGLTFALSAFLYKGSLGIGLGIALLFYFMNLLSNLTADGKFLKYITPFSYADSAYIFKEGTMELSYLLSGWALTVILLIGAWLYYKKKDIHA